MNLNLTGKAVLVTGGGSGIGQTIARSFAREGATVAVNDIAEDRVAETVASIEQAGGRAVAAVCDIGSLDAVRAMADALVARGLRPDILVNNAAVLLASAPFLETKPEDCEREIGVILHGTMNCARVFLPGMIERRYGKVVNIVSDAARAGQEREANYSAAKGGVLAFTKSIAREVGRHNVNVNAVSPAATNTPLRQGLVRKLAERIGEDAVREREEKIRRAYPLKRIGEPDDVSNAVLFLASDAARHITGQVLSVNGGYTMIG
jgi:2-hydroxycyclohexanecarboxyl-CoA dehydrogenase